MKENNKLMAEFIGYKIENKKFQSLEYHSSNESHWVWDEGDIVTLNGNEVSDYSNEPYYSLENLPFDSDWNWLMEVVEKIFSHNHNFKHHREYQDCVSNLEWALTQVDKKILINSCLKYINWYNNQEVK